MVVCLQVCLEQNTIWEGENLFLNIFRFIQRTYKSISSGSICNFKSITVPCPADAKHILIRSCDGIGSTWYFKRAAASTFCYFQQNGLLFVSVKIPLL